MGAAKRVVLVAALIMATVSITTTQSPVSKTLLAQTDFTYLGAFRLPVTVGGFDATWGRGLAHRYVNGQLRFLTTAYAQTGTTSTPVYEVSSPGYSLAPPYPNAPLMRLWGDVFRDGAGNQKLPTRPGAATDVFGLYWDAPTQRLYFTGGMTYWVDPGEFVSLGYATLDESTGKGTATGAWGFKDRSWKFTMGGVLPIPQWFEQAYVPGRRLAAGFGGFLSSGVTLYSMGPALTAFPPNLANYPDQSQISAHTPLVGYPFLDPPWWTNGGSVPVGSNRAERDTDYKTELDWPPHNGKGYFQWADAIWQGGAWIDLPTKHGVIFAALLGNGRYWYGQNENGYGIHYERASHAWFVYNPADFAKVARGETPQWNIQPAQRWPIQYSAVKYPLGLDDQRIPTGVTYDPTTGLLYVAVRFAGAQGEHLVHVYRVEAGSNAPAAPSNLRIIR